MSGLSINPAMQPSSELPSSSQSLPTPSAPLLKRNRVFTNKMPAEAEELQRMEDSIRSEAPSEFALPYLVSNSQIFNQREPFQRTERLTSWDSQGAVSPQAQGIASNVFRLPPEQKPKV